MGRLRTKNHLGLLVPPIATVALLAYLVAVSPPPTQPPPIQQILVEASWAEYYPDLKSLVNRAEVIVLGTVESSESYPALRSSPSVRGFPSSFPFTDHVMRIEAILKGSVAEPIITVSQYGGYLEGKEFVLIGDPLLARGDRAILFLHKFNPGTDFVGPVKERYVILGVPQGRFLVRNGLVYSVGDLHPEERSSTLAVGGKALNLFLEDISSLLSSP